MHGTIRFCMSIPMEGTSKKRGRKQRPSPKRILHFLLQNLRDEFAHPLPQPLLQTLPPGIPLLLVRARCRATVRHGVSSCGRDLQQRDPGFVFNDFSGAYAFHFSTGIGTEPTFQTQSFGFRTPRLRTESLRYHSRFMPLMLSEINCQLRETGHFYSLAI